MSSDQESFPGTAGAASSNWATGQTTSYRPVTEEENTLLLNFSNCFLKKAGISRGPVRQYVKDSLTTGFLKDHEKISVLIGFIGCASTEKPGEVHDFESLSAWVERMKDESLAESDYNEQDKALINERWQTLREGLSTFRDDIFPSRVGTGLTVEGQTQE